MKKSTWLDPRSVVCAAALVAGCLPGIALAQSASGGTPPPGLPPTQLPKAGDAAVDPAGGLPAVLLGGGTLIAGLILRRRAQREADRRK